MANSYPTYNQAYYSQSQAAYQNPNYSYQNMSVSAIPNTQQVQQPQQPQKTYIPGRLVTSENDIVANEVPMDGNYGIFVQSDLQTIYAKTWSKDGLIDTKVYQLVDAQRPAQPDPIAIILERLDRIEKKLGEVPRPQQYQNNNYRKNYHKPNPNKKKEEQK